MLFLCDMLSYNIGNYLIKRQSERYVINITLFGTINSNRLNIFTLVLHNIFKIIPLKNKQVKQIQTKTKI